MIDDSKWSAFTERLYNQNQFAMKLGLANMRRALSICGWSELPYEIILIAGTNGKGTTASYLNAALIEMGASVGLYTSPHLIDFTERFRIDGVPARRDVVFEVGTAIMDRFAGPGSDPCLTFFELTTLMAVGVFASAGVDVAIFEVGLGGRLDATNALEPDVSVITTLGYDHQQYLGDTIDEIALEKLAIRRPSSPLVVGRQEYNIDAALGSIDHDPLFIFGVDFGADEVDATDWRTTHAQLAQFVASRFFAPDQLELAEAEQICKEGMKRALWPGRLEQFSMNREHHPLEFIVDGAHNPDGMRALARWLDSHELGSIDAIIFSTLGDKDPSALSEVLEHPACRSALLYGVELSNPRAASSSRLSELLSPRDHTIADCATVLADVVQSSANDVLVFGSLYLVGALYREMGRAPHELITFRQDESR